MAKFKLELPTEVMRDIEKIYNNTEEIMGAMTRAGAEVVESNMKNNAPDALKAYVKTTKTYRTPSDDGINTKVIVKGYMPFSDPNRKTFIRSGKGGDSYTTTKGVPSEFVAAIFEHGRSGLPFPKKPFVRKSFKKAQIEAAMLKAQSEASGGLLDE